MLYVAINNNVEPPTRGQPRSPNKGQKPRSQSVLYSEVPLYLMKNLMYHFVEVKQVESVHSAFSFRYKTSKEKSKMIV